ncbi:MAG: hypothetical protein VX257_02685, partial [Planctomycetota bacterium]|nr:hypothetical protein [Planctomycetota bacterium]
AIAPASRVHTHLDRPCTEWGGRDDRMERVRRRPVALPGNGDDADRMKKRWTKFSFRFFSIFCDLRDAAYTPA